MRFGGKKQTVALAHRPMFIDLDACQIPITRVIHQLPTRRLYNCGLCVRKKQKRKKIVAGARESPRDQECIYQRYFLLNDYDYLTITYNVFLFFIIRGFIIFILFYCFNALISYSRRCSPIESGHAYASIPVVPDISYSS